MIEVRGVSFTYPGQETPVLKDISFTVKAGDFLAVLGRNGSGKSTLAKLLNGFLVPKAGEVVVDGFSTSNSAGLRHIRQMVGLLFSNPDNQLVSQIVEEDVAFGPENLGLPPEEIKKRVDEALSLVGMEDYRRHPPHLLSGGQKQKVAIAGMLALKPRYLVLDEPTAMLDPRGRAEVMNTLVRLNREEGTGIVLITHFAEEAALAGQVMVLAAGEIAAAGSPIEVLTRFSDLEGWGIEPPAVVQLVHELSMRGLEVPEVLEAKELVRLLCQSYLKK